jgi:cytoskeletal protein CcmA (bactofilin family)
VYNNVSSSWVASNTVAANVDWSYIGNVPYANATANGVVKIVDSTSNTSNSIATSANSVKVAFDAALANGATAYANAVTYAGTIAATAYSNATTYAASIAATAYSNATTYAATIAGTAYSNAIAYAAANSYVNTQLGLKASLSGATFSGAVSGITTLAAGNTTITGSANVSANLTANNVRTYGSVQIDGDLTVSGNTVQVNVTNLSLEDNMIYLNANNTVSHPDLGFAGNYNDGTYRHAGFFRDATDGRWKVFDGYQPEPDASAFIDTANNTFRVADLQANTLYVANGIFTAGVSGITTLAAGNTTITGFANVSANLNTSGTLSANVITVTGNVTTTQTNLQVDAAGTATAMAIVFGG